MRTCSLISVLALVLILGCNGTKSSGTSGKRTEAPKHNAPDQDRIDSLKQEKMKKKP